jgi:FkbM family methyltransferase
MTSERSGTGGLLALLQRTPRLRRVAAAIGRPAYRQWMRARRAYVSRRFGWTFPRSVPDGFAVAFASGRWEPETTALVAKLSAGAVFVDVGANVGYFTRLAAERVGAAGRVYAFEPEPSNFAALLRNTARYSHVHAIPAAVGDRDGLDTLFTTDDGCNSLVVTANRYRWSPTVTFDTFVEASGLETIDLVKIDAEGNEPAVLAGMRRSLDRGIVRAFIIEYAPQFGMRAGSDPEPIVATLLSHYDVVVIERDKYAATAAGPLTPESLRDLTKEMWAISDSMACVNLFAVARTG